MDKCPNKEECLKTYGENLEWACGYCPKNDLTTQERILHALQHIDKNLEFLAQRSGVTAWKEQQRLALQAKNDQHGQ